jgi:hypothetical protein
MDNSIHSNHKSVFASSYPEIINLAQGPPKTTCCFEHLALHCVHFIVLLTFHGKGEPWEEVTDSILEEMPGMGTRMDKVETP